MKKLFSNRRSEKGQGLVEYAILLGLVSVVVAGIMVIMGSRVNCTFDKVNSSLPGTANGSSNCNGSSSGSASSSPSENVVVPTADPYGSFIGAASKKEDDAVENFCDNASDGTSYKLYYNPSSKRYVVGGSATNLSGPNTLRGTGVCDD